MMPGLAVRPLFALSLLFASACFDLPDIEPDVCGNRVVDGEEDCDGFAAYGGDTVCGEVGVHEAHQECLYVCDPAGLTTACPTGWGCGLDGVCNRPQGTFQQTGPWPMAVDEFAIGDVDGDGNADLIGNDPAHITVRFGSATSEFPDELRLQIRRPIGAVTYTRFDDDNRLDAIVPIDLGLFVLRGLESRELEPVTYSPFSSDGDILEFHSMPHPGGLGREVLIVSTSSRGMGFLSQSDEGTGDQVQLPDKVEPGAGPLILPPPVGQINATPRPEFVLAYQGDSAVHVYTTVGEPGGVDGESTLAPSLIQSIALPANWFVHQGALFAQVDGQPGQDLVISAIHVPAASEPYMGILVAASNGTALTAPVRDNDLENFGIDAFGFNLPLASADFDGDGLGDFVTIFGIFSGANPGGIPMATGIPDLWSDAVIGDFNRDGMPDVAVARMDPSTGRVLNGVDFLLASGTGFFNSFHVQTQDGGPRAARRSMVSGDFDGDLIDDVAFLQGDVGAGDDPGLEIDSTLQVAFGAADGRFDEANVMGRFAGWVQMTPGTTAFSPGSLDAITDLFVTSLQAETAASSGSAISVMFGDSSRRMVAPLVLDPSVANGGPPQEPHQPRRALVGDFNQDQINDLLAVTESNSADNKEAQHYVWYIPGATGDGSVQPLAAEWSNLADHDAYGNFNMGCSTWEVIDLGQRDVPTPDELIGLDDSVACNFQGEAGQPEFVVVKVDPDSAAPMEMEKILFGGALSFPNNLSAMDFDGDGDLDPVVLFEGLRGPAGDSSGAGVAVIWNDGDGALGGSDKTVGAGEYSEILLPDGVQPIKVAAIAIDEDELGDLVILTDTGVFIALRDPDQDRSFRQPERIAPFGGRLLGVGDVNGDGLADFAVVTGQSVQVLLAKKAPRLGVAVPDQDSPAQQGGEP
jgi:hypothetical protein